MNFYIYTGRFQPLHNGHIMFMEKAKSLIPRNSILIVCIIRNSEHREPKSYSEFHNESILKQCRKNNPLPNWERYMLLKLAIESNPLLSNNTSIIFRDRSDLDWEQSVIDLPSERIFLLPEKAGTSFDVQKRIYYEEKKEKILEVPNGLSGISGSEIRSQLLVDNNLDFMPEACRSYFKEFCLPYFKEVIL